MKICTVQMLMALTLCGISLAHTNYAQVLDKEITISLTDVPFAEALKEIERVADVKFAYSVSHLATEKPVTIHVEQRSLRDFFQALFEPRNISYKVHEQDHTIALKKYKEESRKYESYTDESKPPGDAVMRVTGTITDAGTRLPMAGVNVIVKGTTKGTTSDGDGRFTIDADKGDVLVFSFIGYRTMQFAIEDHAVIDVELAEDIESLGEVIVYSTGYEDISAERSTGSYSQIGQDLLQRNVGTNLASRLTGVTPSLYIDQRGSQPFLAIRGRSTIIANDQPLIIVDNFPFNGDINTINPNDIETITVLRDAAAASIWGVRAGNGVIVITTKRGAKNKGLQIGFNSNFTVMDKPDLFYQNRISTTDFIDVEQMLFENGFYDNTITDVRMLPLTPVIETLLAARNGQLGHEEAVEKIDALRNADVRKALEKHFYRRAFSQQYALNLSGGSDKSTYFLSAGYDKNQRSQVGNESSRYSINNQNTFNLLKNLELTTRLSLTQTNTIIDNTLSRIRMGISEIYPYARLTDDSGNPVPTTKDYRSTFVSNAENMKYLNWEFNPIKEQGYADNQVVLKNVRLSAGLKYSVTEWLHFNIMYQHEGQTSDARNFESKETYATRNLINAYSNFDGSTVTGRNIPLGGILTTTTSDLSSDNTRIQTNFTRGFGKHKVDAMAGFEIRETTMESISNRLYGYDPDLGSSIPVDYVTSFITYPLLGYAPVPGFQGVNGSVDRYRSYFGNLSYTYNDRLTFFASGRLDQSNLFGVNANQRSTPLWSVGTKWNITNEQFMKSWDAIPVLALRATYGYNGNIDPNVTAFTTARFLQSQWTQRRAARITAPPNPELSWERIGMLNVGIDFELKNSALAGSVEFYKKRGTDLIGFSPLDATAGFKSFKGNVASIKGYGWDIILNSNIINRSVKWSANLLFSSSVDEVTQYEVKPTSLALYFLDGSIERGNTNEYTPTVGKPLFGIYSYKSAGLDPETGQPRGYLNKAPSTDYSGISASSTVDSLVYHGPALPPVFGSLRNNISYRNWSLSFNIAYKFGHYFRRSSMSYSSLYSNGIGHGDFAKRWQQPGDELTTSVPAMPYPANANADAFYLRTDGLVERGDNVRLQDIQLSYNFNLEKLKLSGITQLQLYGYINNVGLIWKANDAGIDPDFPLLPVPRSYSIGARVTF